VSDSLSSFSLLWCDPVKELRLKQPPHEDLSSNSSPNNINNKNDNNNTNKMMASYDFY
jgi:hypothetical protein